jgi:hypothetical protein
MSSGITIEKALEEMLFRYQYISLRMFKLIVSVFV